MFMTDITINIDSMLPTTLTMSKTLLFALVLSIAMILIALFARLLLGKNSSLKHALSSALGILFLYAVCVIIYTFNPRNLVRYVAPLPYVTFSEDKLYLFSFTAAEFPVQCYQMLSMVILAFLVNLVDSFTTKNLKVLGWICVRVFSIVVAIGLHYLVYRLIQALIPNILEGYAPMILLAILVFMFFLGFLKFLLALMLTAVSPVFGGIYTFFFANKVGKNVSKALASTVVMTIFVIVLEHLGYGVIPIGAAALDSYIPFAASLCVLWLIIGFIL